MEKKHALLFALLITLIIAANFYFLTPKLSPQKETAIIARVIDGDTLQLQDSRKIRLLNINAPEKYQPNSNLSANSLKEFQNQSVQIEILGTDKYDRYLARIYSPSYLNLEFVKQGLAAKFLVEESEIKEFSEAESQAIKTGIGIWKHSPYYNCIKSKIDEIGEKAILINNCNKINISSYVLKDESTKHYTFEEIEFKEITLHSTSGKNNATDLFWNSPTNIWNNDRDSLYLFDNQGNLVHYNSYGYQPLFNSIFFCPGFFLQYASISRIRRALYNFYFCFCLFNI